MRCLTFFGYLRVSKLTILTESSSDPSRHLSLNDIALDNRKYPYLLQLHLKESKTDPFKQGVKVYVGATDSPVCPIKAMLSYLSKYNAHSLSPRKEPAGRELCSTLASSP